MIYLKSFGIWLILAISAIVVATFRVAVLLPPFGEQTAHQIGTIIYLIVQFTIIYFFVKRISVRATRRVAPTTLLLIGIFWVIITIIFEFIFGHYVMGNSWEKLFADYNLFNGRLWVLVLINNISAPIISGRIIKQ